MGKRQPMRWSSEGAHLLLQVRCAVLDQRLGSLFREWHPKFLSQADLPLPVVCPPTLIQFRREPLPSPSILFVSEPIARSR